MDVYVSVSGPEQNAPLRLRPAVLNTDVNIEETWTDFDHVFNRSLVFLIDGLH